jgi:hypothetical protein
MFGMRRRDFITLFGSAAAGWPVAAGAQQSRMPLLVLTSASAVGYAGIIAAVQKGLNEAGFLEKRPQKPSVSKSPTICSRSLTR